MKSTKVEISKRKKLQEKLDEIDEKAIQKATVGFYESRLAIEMSMWEKGEAIDAEFRGVKSAKSYYQLEKETDRQRESLKKWHKLFLKYPTKKKYLPIVQEKAHTWTNKALSGQSESLVSKLTGNEENYTPEAIIQKVKEVLGGIDLDPASCEYAQQKVNAKKYYTKDDDGLSKSWSGRVFLNPPYGMPKIREFTDKLIAELPNIQAAIMLTNDQTDTAWWQKCAINAKVICMPSGRLRFYTEVLEETSPTNGQTFFYYGDYEETFCRVFSELGLLVKVMS